MMPPQSLSNALGNAGPESRQPEFGGTLTVCSRYSHEGFKLALINYLNSIDTL
jgi:hypothetical protein